MGAPVGEATILPAPPRLLVFTKIKPSPGSNDTPPQFPPPIVPGKISVGDSPKGVYGPSCRSFANQSAQNVCASGVRVVSSAEVKLMRASGGGLSGNGWVGHDSSPGTSLLGTLRSSTPK